MLADDITTFSDPPLPPGASPWADGVAMDEGRIEIVAHDPQWATVFESLAARIRDGLGDRALSIAHVGSTSVPGLAAKPIVDIDLVVADGADDAAYVPSLEAAGFVLRIREPWWYGHRMLRHDAPLANLHVWSPGTPEVARHLLFRDWLRQHPEDRVRYQEAKIEAADASNVRGETVTDYNARKQQVIREIYHRAFVAAGLLPGA